MVPHGSMCIVIHFHCLLTFCSLGGGSIVLKLRLNSESNSCGILIFTNMPSEFLNHWNILLHEKHRTIPIRNKNNFARKGQS